MSSLSRFLSDSSTIRGKLSLDRVTFLVFSPRLSLWGENFRRQEGFIKQMSFMLESRLSGVLDEDFPQGIPSELFVKHYRTSSGIDIQFGPKMPKRKKISDLSYIMAFGTDSDKENGFMYSYSPNEYAFRVEYNPNETTLDQAYPLLKYFAGSRVLADDVKIARLDIAVDYSTSISPALTFCDNMRKSFIACGTTGIETVYFGSRASKYFVRLYNKAVELREKQNLDVSGDLWRFELECKDSFSLVSTPDLGKVFKRFHFYSGGINSHDWKLNLLLSYARDNGLKAALSFLPKATAKRYKKFFDEFDQNYLIEPPFETYCREFPAALEQLRTQILIALGYKVERLA